MSRENIRVFIAVEIPDPKVLDALSKARDLLVETRADLKPVATENIHLTLRFIGEIPLTLVHEVCRELSEKIKFEPFKIKIAKIGVFPHIRRPRVIWAGVVEGVDKLTQLHDNVESVLRRLRIPPQREKFIPHITLARVRSGRNIDALIKVIQDIADQEFGEIIVDKIVVKRSVLTPSGPIYSDICTIKAQQQ